MAGADPGDGGGTDGSLLERGRVAALSGPAPALGSPAAARTKVAAAAGDPLGLATPEGHLMLTTVYGGATEITHVAIEALIHILRFTAVHPPLVAEGTARIALER